MPGVVWINCVTACNGQYLLAWNEMFKCKCENTVNAVGVMHSPCRSVVAVRILKRETEFAGIENVQGEFQNVC